MDELTKLVVEACENNRELSSLDIQDLHLALEPVFEEWVEDNNEFDIYYRLGGKIYNIFVKYYECEYEYVEQVPSLVTEEELERIIEFAK